MEENKESIIDVLSTDLSCIINGTILRKHEELIPVLLMAIRFHLAEGKRIQLTQLLFNLVNIPNEHQRNLFCMAGNDLHSYKILIAWHKSCCPCVGTGSTSTYAERRVLVAKCTGRVGPTWIPQRCARVLIAKRLANEFFILPTLVSCTCSSRRTRSLCIARLL
jgi:hypothetical protein